LLCQAVLSKKMVLVFLTNYYPVSKHLFKIMLKTNLLSWLDHEPSFYGNTVKSSSFSAFLRKYVNIGLCFKDNQL